MLCSLSEEEYTKVYNLRSGKQMWDTLRNKLSLLTCKYKLFSIDENGDIQCMFVHFQTILNELRSLGRTYDNYNHIDKIMRNLSRKWRPYITMLRALKTKAQ
ncbi:hypothetical protein JHK85_007141 [Glycine max]|uniref:Uncharacterized protein n=1 Tax=Glycine max TaxID=3847 RepID=A0A0R0KGN7_SOYBN|nr:hypothetical protein JHK85_007141 [Glycine max]